jgi:hypothetical protein
MKKVILDLCGGTGSWSQFYASDSRYEVHVITAPQYDVTKCELGNKYVIFESQSVDYPDIKVPVVSIYGILAAPPCTIFSKARRTGKAAYEIRPPFKEGMIVVEACEQIIRHVTYNGYLKFWAMENPKALLRKIIGIPSFTFESWQFGDGGSKPTDIWGYFKEPEPTVDFEPDEVLCMDQKTRVFAEKYAGQGLSRAAIRAITPPGFAMAFYKANR